MCKGSTRMFTSRTPSKTQQAQEQNIWNFKSLAVALLLPQVLLRRLLRRLLWRLLQRKVSLISLFLRPSLTPAKLLRLLPLPANQSQLPRPLTLPPLVRCATAPHPSRMLTAPVGGSSSPSPSQRRLEQALGSGSSGASGSTFSAGAAAGGVKCSGCGHSPVSGKFCSECGQPTASPSAASTPSAAQISAASRIAAAIPDAAPVRRSNGCAACGRDIGLSSVEAMGTNWHKECFVCQCCRKSLIECGFKPHNNLPICGDCYNEQFGLKCSACKKPITSEYVQVAGSPFHRECYA
jgi:hypothetical protein